MRRLKDSRPLNQFEDIIPDSAIDEGNAWIDIHYDYLKGREVHPRYCVTRSETDFDIFIETCSDYQCFSFSYNQSKDEIKFEGHEGDFKY